MALSRTTVIREEIVQPHHATSAAEAKQRGLYMYFTGRPCKHGHVACRYTATYQCVTCARISRQQHRKQKRLETKPILQTTPKPLPAASPPMGLLEAFRQYLIRKLS